MGQGQCPHCETELEKGYKYCHNCGLNLTGTLSDVGMEGSTRLPQLPPMVLFPQPIAEFRKGPLGHSRALTGMAGIVMLFLAAMVIIQAYFFAMDRIYMDVWEEDERGNYWIAGHVVQWEYIIAVIIMVWSFAVAIPGAIFSFLGTRFYIGLTAGVSLLVSAIIIPADTYDFGLSFADYDFDYIIYPILGGIAVGLLLLSNPMFHPSGESQKSGDPQVSGIRDGYGWFRGDGP